MGADLTKHTGLLPQQFLGCAAVTPQFPPQFMWDRLSKHVPALPPLISKLLCHLGTAESGLELLNNPCFEPIRACLLTPTDSFRHI